MSDRMTLRNSIGVMAVGVVAIVLAGRPAPAPAAVLPDLGFGNQGITMTGFGGNVVTPDSVSDLAMAGDGRIAVARLWGRPRPALEPRDAAPGRVGLDPGFGNNGLVLPQLEGLEILRREPGTDRVRRPRSAARGGGRRPPTNEGGRQAVSAGRRSRLLVRSLGCRQGRSGWESADGCRPARRAEWADRRLRSRRTASIARTKA